MIENLTDAEKATNFETFKHIERVRNLINIFCKRLQKRGEKHDQSKLKSPEVEMFTKYTSQLKGLTYGSQEYKECLDGLGPALKHHYENNSHHPEHYKNGIDDMDLLDIVEMLLDWKAAGERHKDDDIFRSIEINTERFDISPQLQSILYNTANRIWGNENSNKNNNRV